MSATDRQLFDLFNASPWDTAELRIDQAVECLISRGMKRATAEAVATDAHGRWVAAIAITRAN